MVIISAFFTFIFIAAMVAVGWLLTRSAMFSALKKYENWKNSKAGQ
jgi:hypothetical protein